MRMAINNFYGSLGFVAQAGPARAFRLLIRPENSDVAGFGVSALRFHRVLLASSGHLALFCAIPARRGTGSVRVGEVASSFMLAPGN